MGKKFLSMLLVLALCLSLGVTAFASGEAEEETSEETTVMEETEEAAIGEDDAEDTLPEEPVTEDVPETDTLSETVAAEEKAASEPVPVTEETSSLLPAEEEPGPEAGESPADAATAPAEEAEVQVLAAGGQQEEEVLEDTLVYVNPLYADVLTEEDIQEAAETIEAEGGIAPLDTVYYTTPEELGEYFREQMTARQTILTFSYISDEFSEDGLAAFLQEAVQEATIHTVGDPIGGDYLLYQMGGYAVVGGSYNNRSGVYYVNITIAVVYYTSAEQEAAVDAKVSEVLASLGLDGKSDYEKICAIYDYICDNVTYDYAHLNDETYLQQFTAYAALIDGTAVCQGYANLFYRMAMECGIDARIIAGYGYTGNSEEPHAWNIVELDGVYYNLDATWDAGQSTYTYFLRSDANFINHTRGIDVGGSIDYTTAEFYAQYPMSSEDYATHGSEDHTWDAGTVTKEPTCTVAGVMTYTCSECGETYTERIAATGHSFVEYGTVDVDQCEQEIIYKCEKCGETYVDEVDVLGHDYTAKVTKPTCTAQGYTTYTCSRCGDSYQDNSTSALGHDYYEMIVSPTCTEQGYALYTCTRCGDSYQDEFTDALGHTWDAGKVTKVATASAAGVMTYTCTVCGETYTEAIPALGGSSDSADRQDTGSSDSADETGTGSSTPATSGGTLIFTECEDTGTVDDGTEVDIRASESSINSAQTDALDDLQLEAGNVAFVLDVEAYDPETGAVLDVDSPITIVFTIEDADQLGSVLCWNENTGRWDEAVFTVNGDQVTVTFPYPCTAAFSMKEANSHTPGDINDDDKVNISDVQILLKYVNLQPVSVNEYALDVNGDGTVNISDVQTLLKSVNGQDVTIY